MSTVISISTRRRYGVAWVRGFAQAGVYHRAAEAPSMPRRRPGPEGAMPDAPLVAAWFSASKRVQIYIPCSGTCEAWDG